MFYLYIDLVATEDDRNVFTHSFKVAVPVGNIFVSDTRSDVKHNDTALPLDVITITKTSELFLTRSVPNIEANSAEVGVESKRVDFNTKGS